MELIKTTKGKFAEIDDEDLEKVGKYKWQWAGRYVKRSSLKEEGFGYRKSIALHRFILNAKPEVIVDHIDGNTINNRKSNLRTCTHIENLRNTKIYSSNKSGYKGVSERYGKWGAHIRINKKLCHIGQFDTKEKAAKAYNKMAKRYFGKFAKLNII